MNYPCLKPYVGWYCGAQFSKDGVYSPNLIFSRKQAIEYFQKHYGSSLVHSLMQLNETTIDCGRCLSCRLKKRRDMTTRLNNELSMFGDDCCFITLTYDDEHIPTTCIRSIKDADKMIERGSTSLPVETLLPSDVQKFIKRLRRHLEYQPLTDKYKKGRDHVKNSIRYFAVGEYGGKTARPHYHILIFGWKPSDMEFFSYRNKNVVYRSKQIEKLWKYGFSTVQPCGLGVARYVSRYVTKKFVNNSKSAEPFLDSYFPEFTLQSVRHGGIGAIWFDKHIDEVLSRGFVSFRCGLKFIKAPIPRYYINRLRRKNLELWLELRDERMQFIHRKGKQSFDVDELLSAMAKNEKDIYNSMQGDLF